MPLKPEDVDKITASGNLTPETAARLKSSQFVESPVSEPPKNDDIFSQASEVAEIKRLDSMSEKMSQLQTDIVNQEASLKDRIANEMARGIPEEGVRNKFGRELEIIEQKKNELSQLNQSVEAAPLRAPDQQEVATEQGLDVADFINPNQAAQSQAPDPTQNILSNINNAFNAQQNALTEGALAGQKAAVEEAAFLEETSNQLSDLQARQAEKAQERQAEFDKAIEDYNQTIESVNNAEVDPERFWKTRSTGQKIAAVLGATLAGYGAGLQGSSHNPVLDMLQKSIDNDLAAQRMEIDKLKSTSNLKNNVLAQMRAKFDNDEQAEAAAKSALLDRAQLQLKSTASKYKSAEIQANAHKAVADIELRKQELALKFQKATQAKVLRAGQVPEQDFDFEQLDKGQRERFIPGMGVATTKEGATKVREMKGIVDGADRNLQLLRDKIGKVGSDFSFKDRAAANTAAVALRGALRLALIGPGAVSDHEQKILERVIADPTAIFSLSSSEKASMDSIMAVMKNNFNTQAEANGLTVPGTNVKSFKAAE